MASGVINEEYVIPCFAIDSLQYMAAVRVIVSSCNHSSVKNSIDELFAPAVHKPKTRIEGVTDTMKAVNDCINQLPLPKQILEIMRDYVEIVVKKLVSWIVYLNAYVFDAPTIKTKASRLIEYVKWNSRGLVNYVESARSLIRSFTELTDENKFRIIAIHCLEDLIWTISYENIKVYCDSTPESRRNLVGNLVVLYWASCMAKDFSKVSRIINYWSPEHLHLFITMDQMFAFIFRQCLTTRIPLLCAADYFFRKLEDPTKFYIAASLIPYSAMDLPVRWQFISKQKEQDIFKKFPHSIFACLLEDVYWRNYFVHCVKRYHGILSLDGLTMICKDIECVAGADGFDDFYYSLMLTFWKCLTRTQKLHLIRSEKMRDMIRRRQIFPVFHTEYTPKIFAEMLSDLDYVDVKDFMFSVIVKFHRWKVCEYVGLREKVFYQVLTPEDAENLLNEIK